MAPHDPVFRCTNGKLLCPLENIAPKMPMMDQSMESIRNFKRQIQLLKWGPSELCSYLIVVRNLFVEPNSKVLSSYNNVVIPLFSSSFYYKEVVIQGECNR